MVTDRGNYLMDLNEGGSNAKLELGCGPFPKREGFITTDVLDFDCVNLVGDVYEVLSKINDDSLNEVYACHFIEHIDDLTGFLDEVIRVCRDGALIEFHVPHHSNSFFYSDPTHKNFFGLYTFHYFANDRTGLKRSTPTYKKNIQLEIVEAKLGFRSFPPYYIRHGFRKVVEIIVNSTNYTKELYEENFSGWISCYELKFKLRVNKGVRRSQTDWE